MNVHVANTKFRYTYNTFSSDNEGNIVITSHYKFDTGWTHKVQNAGVGISVVGYGATLTGVGAEIGAPAAAIGNTMTTFGSFSEILLDRLNGDIDNSFKGMTYYLLEKVVEKGVDKLMPGNVGPSSKDVVKYLINKFTGHGNGKKILPSDFDLGKSIKETSI